MSANEARWHKLRYNKTMLQRAEKRKNPGSDMVSRKCSRVHVQQLLLSQRLILACICLALGMILISASNAHNYSSPRSMQRKCGTFPHTFVYLKHCYCTDHWNLTEETSQGMELPFVELVMYIEKPLI